MRASALTLVACACLLLAPVAGGRREAGPVVPAGALLAADRQGDLAVLDRSGHVLRQIHVRLAGCCQAVELAGDRRHAFLAVRPVEVPSLYEIDLASGRARRLGTGGSPALSPGGGELAYYAVAFRNDILYRTGIAVRDLATGSTRVIPFSHRTSWSTPPDVLLNWAPDGQKLALADMGGVRIVDVAAAADVESQPLLSGLTAPAFLADGKLVALANCCIGKQRMTSVDIGSGTRAPFVTLPEPPESLRRIAPGSFATTTPDGYLILFSRGKTRRIATGYFAVSG